MLEVCAAAGAASEAVSLVGSLPGLGVEPSARHVGAAIAACTRAGTPERGLALLRSLRAQGGGAAAGGRADGGEGGREGGREGGGSPFPLDQPALSAALAACARVGDAEMTSDLLAELRGQGGPGRSAPRLDAKARCSAIAAYGRAGQWREAARLLASAGAADVDTACYNAALGALLRAGQRPAAELLLRRMTSGTAPPPDGVTRRIVRSGNLSSAGG